MREGNRFLKPLAGMTVALAALVAAAPAGAQAWLPKKGEIITWVGYTQSDGGDHLFSFDFPEGVLPSEVEGDRENGVDLGDIRSQTTFVGAEWAPTRRLAVSGTAAYVSSRYRGGSPESGIDDGSYNGSLQDLGVRVRYATPIGPVALAPFIGTTIPLKDYETLGHSSAGRGLTQVSVGLNVGLPLGRVGYAHGQYQYTAVENVEQFGLDRSNGTAEVGFFVGRTLTLRAFGAWQHTNDGLSWGTGERLRGNDRGHEVHDAAAGTNYSRVGGGLRWQPLPDLGFFASYSSTIWGENTHEADDFTFGTSWRIR